MDPLAELEKQVERNNNVINSGILVMKGLKEKLDAAGTDKVKLKALSDSLASHEKTMAEAIIANDPNIPHVEHH